MYASLWHIPLTGSVIPSSKTLQYENRFPFSVMNETHSKTSYISMQTLKTRKHKQLYAGGKFQSFHLTLGCTWHRISSINGPFLSDGGKPHTHTYTHSKHRHTLIGQTPHVLPRSIQSSVNVSPWERGFILEWHGIFTPFITASLLHTHLGFPTLPTQFNSLCIMHNTTLRHPHMSLQSNIKTNDRVQHHNELFKVNKSPNLEILWVYSTFGWSTLNSTHPVYMCKRCH